MDQLLVNKDENLGSSIRESYTEITVIYSILACFLIVVSLIICCGKKNKSPDTVAKETKQTEVHVHADLSHGPQQQDSHQLQQTSAIKPSPSPKASFGKQSTQTHPETKQSAAPVQSTSTYKKVIPKPICEGSKLGRLAKMAIAAEAKKASMAKAKGKKGAKIDPKKSAIPQPSPKSMSWPSLTPDHTYYGIPLNMEMGSFEVDQKNAAKIAKS